MSISLDKLPNDRGIVGSIALSDSAAKRLKALGVFEGQHIQIARRGDPLIVKAAGSRIAIAKDLAKNIHVESPT